MPAALIEMGTPRAAEEALALRIERRIHKWQTLRASVPLWNK